MGVKEFAERIERMFLARNLKFLRESKGWTQREIANALDISAATIANYEIEAREPGLEMLVKLARFFSVTIDDLLLKKMEPEKPLCLINLPYLRKKHNFTMEYIAKYLGFKDKSSYSLIEAGKINISVENLMKLSDLYEVTMDDLVRKNLEESTKTLSFKEMLGGE